MNTLKILSYNVAGIPSWFAGFVTGRKRRLIEVARKLKEAAYQVVGLQEVWFKSDVRLIQEISGFPYAAYHKNSIPFGNGLLLLSRHPIEKTEFFHYGGIENKVNLGLGGDYFCRKGALAARVRVGSHSVDVYNTHFLNTNLHWRHHELSFDQIRDLKRTISEFSADRPFVVTADLNLYPKGEVYDFLLSHAGVKDAFGVGNLPRPDKTHPEGFVDYILFSAKSPDETVLDRKLDFQWHPKGVRHGFSDHQALGAEICLKRLGVVPA